MMLLIINAVTSGNVGIGTTNPTGKLDVREANVTISTSNSMSDGVRGLKIAGSNAAIEFAGSGNDWWVSALGSGLSIYDTTANSYRFKIMNDGKVGIGTTSPSQKLHVDGNARVTGAYYDSGNTPGTANQLLSSTATGTAWIDPSTIVAEAATLVVIACKNTTGATITKGTPVYQTGNVGATATIEIAPADALISANKLPAIGLLQTDLNNNGFGNVVITGELTNFTTDPIDGLTPTVGDKIFVKSGGGLTLTKPTGEGNGIQNMGLVGKVSSGNAGSITVSSIMRTNDVPNLPEGRIWVGDGNTIVSDTVYLDEPNERMGIGTTSPGTKLHVGTGSGATVDTGYQMVIDSVGIAGLQILSATNQSGRIVFGDSGDNDIGMIKYDHTDNSMGFRTNGSGNERMRINSSGNVGIGTTNPSEKLEVNGSVKVSNAYPRIYLADTQGVPRTFSIGTSNEDLIINSGSTDVLSILGASGNVGIGTTAPTQKLQVDGRIRIPYNSSNSYYFGQDNGSIGYGSMHPFDNGGNYTFDTYYVSTGSYKFKYNGTEIFRLRNTGAFAFGSGGNDYGTSGQILKSNGNASPTWIDGSAIPGVPSGSGTLNTIPLWTPDGDTLGNSIITQPTSAEVRVAGILKVNSPVTGYSSTKIQTGGFSDSQSGINILNSTTGYGYILFGDGSGADLYKGQIAYKHGDDFMAFNTNGSERIRIDSIGRIGIGTTSPGAKLHVDGTAIFDTQTGAQPFYITRDGVANQALKIYVDDAAAVFESIQDETADDYGSFIFKMDGGTTHPYFDIRKGNATQVRFDGSGNVGIGTTSPAAKLDIDNGAVTDVRIRGNQTSDARIGAYNFYNTAASDVVAAISADRDGANDAAALAFDTQIAGGGMTERMRITSTGNVGIGAIPRTINTYKVLDISGSGGAGGYIGLSSGSTQQGELYSHSGGVDLVAIGAKNTRFYTNGSERMRITSDGKVGIGTTSPDTLLHIESTSNASSPIFTIENDNDIKLKLGAVRSTAGTAPDSTFIAYDGDLRFIADADSTTEVVRIDSSGNVGIGTTSPGAKLSVVGTSSITGSLTLGTTAGSNLNMLRTSANYINATNATGYLVFRTGGYDTALTLDASQNATFAGNINLPTDKYLRFTSAASGSSGTVLFGNTTGTAGDLTFKRNSDSANMFKITGSGNAEVTGKGTSAATISSDGSSTLTTKGYVDSLITGATIYRGAWDPSGGGYGSPDLSGVTQTSGYYYICSADGTAEPNGTGTEPDTWAVGDWVIYNDVSGTGQWQKIDNSSVLSGVGTGQTVALWEGAGSVTDSETLGNAPITVSGNNTTFAGDINFGDSHFIGDDADDNLLIQGSANENIIIDSADDLILDAGGNDIRFKVNSVEYGKFKNDSGDFSIFSSIQDKDILFKGNDGGSTITALALDMSEGGNATFAGNITVGTNANIDNNLTVSGGNITLGGTGRIQGVDTVSASTDAANKAYVDNSVAAIITPAAPSTVTSTIVGETIEIAFNQSATSDIDYYQVWSSDDGGDYGIIGQITSDDFSSTMTVIDTTFVTGGTMSYRVYAVRQGVYSSAATTSKSYTVSALSVTNMTVVNLNTAYYIQYEKPNSRFIDHIEIYMDSQTTQAALNRSNASIVYSGQNHSYMKNVNTSNNFHQFWVEIVTS